MEIKLGIADVAREVTLESEDSVDSITARFAEALAAGGLFELTDVRGRKVVVPAARVGYLELGSGSARQVGFGAV